MKKGFLVLLYGIAALGAHAQSVGPKTLNATGKSSSLAGNTYEWSVGEMTLVHTATAGSLVVTQGVLQPKISSTGVNSITNAAGKDVDVYPVPTQELLFIQPHFNTGGEIQLALYDATGKQLLLKNAHLIIGTEKQSINMDSYAVGDYVLSISFSCKDERYTTSRKVQKLR